MDRTFRVSTFFFLLAVFFAISTAVSGNEPMEFEEIKDPELKERVAQDLSAADGETQVDDGRAPSASVIAQEKRLPYPLCGLFILCERKGGFYGFPDAKLFTSHQHRISARASVGCTTERVKGTSSGGSNFNHARIWPLFGEEFYEMCFYYEHQHSCTTGRVSVVGSNGHVLYQCDERYEAHTVTFCLSKYRYYCRYRNPIDIIFATVSPATARA